MQLVGLLGELVDNLGEVVRKWGMEEAWPENHILFLHFPLLDYLLIKEVVKAHLIVF